MFVCFKQGLPEIYLSFMQYLNRPPNLQLDPTFQEMKAKNVKLSGFTHTALCLLAFILTELFGPLKSTLIEAKVFPLQKLCRLSHNDKEFLACG